MGILDPLEATNARPVTVIMLGEARRVAVDCLVCPDERCCVAMFFEVEHPAELVAEL